MSAQCWRTLGIKATDDRAAIRRAYADKLKALDVDNDVAGFARLRQARDTALRLAASAAAKAAAAAPPEASEEAEDRGNAGDYGLHDDWEAAPFGPDTGFTDQSEPHEAGNRDQASEPPPESDSQRIERQLRALAQLLFPGGEYSDEGFTLADYEAALVLVDGLVAEAQAARLEVHSAIDHHLAEMMAQGWPRSAALVERANEEFGWLGESGAIDERHALRFLNLRIRGMRFTENVQQASHPLNKVWTELARPGDPKAFDRFRVQKNQVRFLLNGIRERYPEVESHLNPERVGWWDGNLNDDGPGLIGHGIRGFSILWLAIVLLGAIGRCASNSPETDSDPPAFQTALPEEEIERGLDLAIDTIMGAGAGEALASDAAAFEARIGSAYRSGREIGESHEEATARALGVARAFALDARRPAEFEELVAINEVLRLWLRSVDREGSLERDCAVRFGSEQGLSEVVLSDAEMAVEMTMYRQLRAAGLLAEQPEFGRIMADIPGEIVGATIDQSGLDEEAVRASLSGEDDTQRCRVQLALLDVVLARPGTVPIDLLRVL